MIKKSLLTICTFAFLFFFAQNAQACLCSLGNTLSAEGQFSSSEVVFVGKVLDIKSAERAMNFVSEDMALKLPKSVVRERLMIDKVQIVKLEVIEPFKGVKEKTFELITNEYNGGGNCGILFRKGESYLIFTDKRQSRFSKEDINEEENKRAERMLINVKIDKFNELLPLYETSICTRTDKLKFLLEEVEEIRNFRKTGTWNGKKPSPPTRILY